MSQRASYIGVIQADQTVESDHSDLLVQWGTRLPGHVLLQIRLKILTIFNILRNSWYSGFRRALVRPSAGIDYKGTQVTCKRCC
jgi:hypothetical protein